MEKININLSDLPTEERNQSSNRVVPILYKYRSFDNEGLWRDWINGEVIAQLPKMFNDPFDCILSFSEDAKVYFEKEACKLVLKKYMYPKPTKIDYKCIELSDNPIATCLDRLKNNGITISNDEIYTQKTNMINDKKILRQKARVTCYSKVNDSILMWSHYSSNHTGFCIEYDFSSDDLYSQHLYQVQYSKYRMFITTEQIRQKGWLKEVLTHKASEWKYEYEWRFILMCNSVSTNLFSIDVSKYIKAIYLGISISDENKKELCKLAHEKNISVYSMEIDSVNYRLNVAKL